MTSSTTSVPEITLTNGLAKPGVRIPQLGFGVWQVDPDETQDAVATALEIGYRHIDTAEMYRNEAGVGAAVRESGIPRDQIFVTSKLNNSFHKPEQAAPAFEATLATLDIEYVDLFLMHWPLPTTPIDYADTWAAMVALLETGRLRAVGVSNFQQNHLEHLFETSDVVPAVNQIEIHPFLTQDALRAFHAEHGIATEAWSPLASGNVVDDATIKEIAKEVDRSPAQVGLRWTIQRGEIVFPKSVTRARIEENLDLFSFELSDEQMQRITALSRDLRTGPNPDTFDWIPQD